MGSEKDPVRYKTGLWLTKDNNLIRMHGNMTPLSYKLTNYFLLKAIKEGRLDNLQITASEMVNVLGIKDNNLMKVVDAESNKIMKTIIEVKKTDTSAEWEKITLIPHMKYEKGVATAKINPDLVPYINGLTGNFTRTDYEKLNSCSSYPAMRLAEVCNSWANTGFAYYTVEEWRALLGATGHSYDVMSQFRRRVLNPAVKEVNEHMGFLVTPLEVKSGRKTTHIKMFIEVKEKTNLEEKEEVPGIVTYNPIANSTPAYDEPIVVAAPKKKRGRPKKNAIVKPKVDVSELTSLQLDVVNRMVEHFGYAEDKAIEAVKLHGIIYCQQQMEIVRNAIRSAELSGREIRSKAGYLNEALKSGYAQINESIARAKAAEAEESKDKALWDKQAKEFFSGKDNDGSIAAEEVYVESMDIVQSEKDKVTDAYTAWEEKKKDFRLRLFEEMNESGNIDFGQLHQALLEFDKKYPCPTQKEEGNLFHSEIN